MGLFKSLKGNHPETVGGASSPQQPTGNPAPKQIYSPSSSKEAYTPPPGPPPSHISQYAPPSGPPPSSQQYAPPPGSPPGHQHYTPPSGPPPSIGEPPPYHDWTVIPDTSTLPPPPAQGHEQPYRNNADPNEADRAHDWCMHNRLVFPHQPTSAQVAAVANGDVRLMKPREYRGDLLMPGTGSWRGSTRAGMKDACLLTSSPLYFALADSPVHTGRSKTIYFEVEILSTGYAGRNNESTIALGFCAMPYPTFRLPGWERGSLAVHSDDGRRYVNDTWGGKDFTSSFQVGETIGLGMSFSVPENPPEYNVETKPAVQESKVEIFLTRNGKRDSSWDLHEQLDHELDRGIEGLDGLFDLYGAVGIFGGLEFTVKFKRDEWIWRPH